MTWYVTFLPRVDPWHMMSASSFIDMLTQKLNGNVIGIIYPTQSPFISVGYHQEIRREVNLKLCQELGIPVIRRDTGGGTVIITKNQQGYRIGIVDKDYSSIKEAYQKYLLPVVYSIRECGLPAELRGQDIVIKNKKVSGNGAVSLENSLVLTGSVILRNDLINYFNCLKVSEEKFRDKIVKSMTEWITGIYDELGREIDFREILINNFKKFWNPQEYKITEEDLKTWDKYTDKLKEEQKDKYQLSEIDSCFKISDIVFICHIDKKFGKLLRITVKIINGIISEVEISGDFFVIPRNFIEILEKSLLNEKIDGVEEKINTIFDKVNPKIYGFTKEEFINTMQEIKNNYMKRIE
ncbi:lipoate--protein ligase [Acidianus sulfidivorans]|nr:lipoate--protein ligase [Acidianus sulfidivorans]